MNENCRGCTSLMTNKSECLYTKIDVEALPDCPCQSCLVKIVCQGVCDDFMKAYNFHHHSSVWEIKESKVLYSGLKSRLPRLVVRL